MGSNNFNRPPESYASDEDAGYWAVALYTGLWMDSQGHRDSQ